MSSASVIEPGAARPPQTEETHAARLLARFRQVRDFSERLCETLEPEDYVVQSMPDVSPTKWHLAHTSWFFETFVLKVWMPSYRTEVPQYAYLFNSYYNAAGDMHRRDLRGLISRPTVAETYRFRQSIDARIQELLESADDELLDEMEPVFTLGLHHEQQHQELLVTDIKHVFSQNPLHPVFRPRDERHESGERSRRASYRRISRKRSWRSGTTAAVSATITKGRDIARSCPLFPSRRARSRTASISPSSKRAATTRPEYLAFVRLDDGQRTALAGAALLDETGRALVEFHPLRIAPDQRSRAGHARELLRSGRVRELGRRASADGV